MGNICPACNKDYTTSRGCVDPVVFIDGEPLVRVRVSRGTDDVPEGDFCSDCGAESGNIHHIDCSCERCPKCGGYLVDCGCRIDGYGDVD